MDEIKNLLCPNCGGALAHVSQSSRFTCPACGRELEMRSPRKVIIAEPLADFAAPDQARRANPAPAPGTSAPPWVNTLSPQRKKRSAELAQERLTQERVINFKTRGLGIWSIVLGIFALGMGWLRWLYLQDDWMGVAMGVFGALSLCGGLVMTLRFYFTARALTENDKEREPPQ